MNDRFRRNQDGSTDTRTGTTDDDTFRSFARWVNNPVSDTAYHHIPDDLQEAVDDVDDPKERQRLRAVLQAYERRELSPRDFVRLMVESDHIDHFDPLSTPEGWGSYGEDGFDGPPEADTGRLLLAEGDDVVDDADLIGMPCVACSDGELTKGVDGEPLEPDRPWCDECGWVFGDDFDTASDRVVSGGVTDKGRAPSTDRPSFPWVEVAVGLIAVLAIVAAVWVVTGGLS